MPPPYPLCHERQEMPVSGVDDPSRPVREIQLVFVRKFFPPQLRCSHHIHPAAAEPARDILVSTFVEEETKGHPLPEAS